MGFVSGFDRCRWVKFHRAPRRPELDPPISVKTGREKKTISVGQAPGSSHGGGSPISVNLVFAEFRSSGPDAFEETSRASYKAQTSVPFGAGLGVVRLPKGRLLSGLSALSGLSGLASPPGHLHVGCISDTPCLQPHILNGDLEGAETQLWFQRFHLDTMRMAGVVPHLGLPVRGPLRQHGRGKSKLSPGPHILTYDIRQNCLR